MTTSPWTAAGDHVRLSARITPKGGRDAIQGLSVDADGRAYLTIRVATAPENGAANEAVRRLVAQALGLRVRDIDIVAGATSRYKQLRIAGAADDIIARLETMVRTEA